jgi:hypothetical protein
VNEMMNFEPGFEQRLALLGRQELGDLFGLLFDQLAGVKQHLPAIFRRGVRPFAQRRFGGADRLLDVLGVPFGGAIDHGARCRVPDLVRFATRRIDGFSSNEHLGHMSPPRGACYAGQRL